MDAQVKDILDEVSKSAGYVLRYHDPKAHLRVYSDRYLTDTARVNEDDAQLQYSSGGEEKLRAWLEKEFKV